MKTRRWSPKGTPDSPTAWQTTGLLPRPRGNDAQCSTLPPDSVRNAKYMSLLSGPKTDFFPYDLSPQVLFTFPDRLSAPESSGRPWMAGAWGWQAEDQGLSTGLCPRVCYGLAGDPGQMAHRPGPPFPHLATVVRIQVI